MNLVISKCVTAVKVSNFTGDYLPNRWTLDIGVLGFFGIVSHKEHPPEVWFLPPVTPCIHAIRSLFTVTQRRPSGCRVSVPRPAATFVHEICTTKIAQLYSDFRMEPRDPCSCAYTVTFIVSSERKTVGQSAFHFISSRLDGWLTGWLAGWRLSWV